MDDYFTDEEKATVFGVYTGMKDVLLNDKGAVPLGVMNLVHFVCDRNVNINLEMLGQLLFWVENDSITRDDLHRDTSRRRKLRRTLRAVAAGGYYPMHLLEERTRT